VIFNDACFGLHDGRLGLGNCRGGARNGGRVLGDLRVERIGYQASQHIAPLHAHTLIRKHLGDAQSLDLRSDQNLFAGYQRTGGEHGLSEVSRADARHGHHRSEGIIGVRVGGGPTRCRTRWFRQRFSHQSKGDHCKGGGEHTANQNLSHDRPLTPFHYCWKQPPAQTPASEAQQ
jgi:hypothetical protein